MHEFDYYAPTKVVFGRDAEKKTAELVKWAGGSRALIVYGGGSAVKSGLLGRVRDGLESAGIAVETLGGVQANPLLSLAREGVKKAVGFGADIIVAIGGGSVIDTAKAVAIGAANPEKDIWDDFWIGKCAADKVLPVGAVLTISAAGSEMSNATVLTKEETKEKYGYAADSLRPKFAVLNPELTFTLPKDQIGCGVVDIMMHTLERYFTCRTGNRLTDRIAESVLRTAVDYGPVWQKEPDHYEAASEIMWASSVSHNGLTGLGGMSGPFVVHQLGMPLSGLFDSPHGATLSAMWGDWAKYVKSANPARFASLGRALFDDTKRYATDDEAADAAIGQMVDFFRSLDMPTSIGGLGVGILPDERLRELADRCSLNGSRSVGNFRPIDRGDMYEIYKMANR